MKKSIVRIIIFLSLIFGVASCASLPDAHKIIAEAEERITPPIIVGPKGAMTEKQSEERLAGLGVSAALRHHLAIEQALTQEPLIAGHSTHILHDGEDAFRAIFDAIKGARKYIYLEYYILEDIESDGMKLSDLLIKKRRAGVEVNMLYDSFGSSNTPLGFFDRLKKARINILPFNPLNPLMAHAGYAPNSRDHRKMLIVDGSTAILGGTNLSTTYQSSVGKSSAPPGLSSAYWRDTDIIVRGPVVSRLERLFIAQWVNQGGPPISRSGRPGGSGGTESEIIRIIGSTPDKAIPVYYTILLSALRHAQERIWLTSAYFVPTDEQLDALIAATRRGVDVRLLLPDMSDTEIAVTIQRSHYRRLLKAGVKIYERHEDVLHSKTVVIDGVWSAIGSSNFDYRSVVFNDEVDLLILGRKTGGEMESMFEKDSAGARQITLAAWNSRPLSEKMKEVFLPLWTKVIKPYL